MLMTRHYSDLVCASDWMTQNFQPTQIWVVTCHQYGICVLIPQTSFCAGEISGGVMKCRLLPQVSSVGESYTY